MGSPISGGACLLRYCAVQARRFEADHGRQVPHRCLERLVGPYPQSRQTYVERSPINAIDGFSAPVIFFQGEEDKVVPPNQAEMMVSALKRKRLPFSYLLFAGEQHGFRKSATIKRALDAELYFYATVVLKTGLRFQ